MNSQKKIINELRFQLSSKEVKDQHYPVQLSASDANAILTMLKEQPDIVRCKDCKYWRQLYGDKPFYSHVGCCDCDDVWRSIDGETTEVNDIRTDSDFYCGYAVRR